jgi:hypothetical protein
MFEKTSRLAEQVATSVSRRGFLGSLGGWAATTALGVAGVLARGQSAWAGSGGFMCCLYETQGFSVCATATEGASCPCPILSGFGEALQCWTVNQYRKCFYKYSPCFSLSSMGIRVRDHGRQKRRRPKPGRSHAYSTSRPLS